jgi:hypothetical protein
MIEDFEIKYNTKISTIINLQNSFNKDVDLEKSKK